MTTIVTTELPMASLTLKRTSPYYFACFRDHQGRQCRRSTHETNERLAQKTADLYEGIARRKINARKIRKTVQELCREIGGDDMPSASLKDYCQSWLKQKEREVKPGTMELYEKGVRKFLCFLGPRASDDLADVTKRDVVAWRDSQAPKLSAATVNLDLKVTKMIFKAARRDGYLELDPCEFVPMIKKDSGDGVRRPFALEEWRRLLEVADDEWRSLILFGVYSGQRFGDLAALTWSNIDLMRDEVHLTTGKTGKRLTVPMAAPLKEHIMAMPTPDDPNAAVHPRAYATLARDRRVRCLSNQFGKLLAAAGLRPSLRNVCRGVGRSGRREALALSFHCLRHTTVSLMREGGAPEAAVMEMVGHNSVSISRHYCHVGHAALQKAADVLPRL